MNSKSFRELENVTFDEGTLTLTASAEELNIRELNIILAKNSLGLFKQIEIYSASSQFKSHPDDTVCEIIEVKNFECVQELMNLINHKINMSIKYLARRYQEYLARTNQYELFNSN